MSSSDEFADFVFETVAFNQPEKYLWNLEALGLNSNFPISRIQPLMTLCGCDTKDIGNVNFRTRCRFDAPVADLPLPCSNEPVDVLANYHLKVLRSNNKNLTVDHILSTDPNLWDIQFLCVNDCFWPDDLLILLSSSDHYRQYNKTMIAWNYRITTDWMDAHPEIEWEKELITYVPNDYPLAQLFEFRRRNYLSQSIVDRFDRYLSQNIFLTIDDVVKSEVRFVNVFGEEQVHQVQNWEWYQLSANPAIKLSDINDHPEFPWEHHSMAINPNMTIDYIKNHPEVEWNYYGLSGNKMTLNPYYKQLQPPEPLYVLK